MQISNITFGQKVNIYHKGENTIKELFDDENRLSRLIEYDKFDRDIEAKSFDTYGNIIERMSKTYTDNGMIEHFKNAFQEYTRKTYTIIENGIKHRVEEFKSKTNPNCNYINEFIYDISGKLIKLISNGKITDLTK